MNARTLVVIMVFVAWAAASLYFTIAGCDSSEDCAVAYLPAPHALTPDENAYTAIKDFADNLPSNRTPLSVNYRLRLAYLNGTTNRLALADEARAFIAAESNTIVAAERILAAKGIDVPFEEVLTALPHCCNLMRIAHVYKVKATYEAAQGDFAAGRKSLMDVYRIGRFLQTQDSLLLGMSELIGGGICGVTLATAQMPLFAPDGDESWRVKLRELNLALLDGDAERVKTAARRGFAGFTRAKVNYYATNRVSKARMQLAAAVFPGYARFSFQPNRTLEARRAELEEFCRKVDEPVYDIEYAMKSNVVATSMFQRNWIGHLMFLGDDYGGLYKLFFRTRFYVRANLVILACRSYKAKHGEYPETLSALVPEILAEVPRDPYDGNELRYDAKGRFLWTLGERLSFDGVVRILGNGKPYFKRASDSRCVRFLDEPILAADQTKTHKEAEKLQETTIGDERKKIDLRYGFVANVLFVSEDVKAGTVLTKDMLCSRDYIAMGVRDRCLQLDDLKSVLGRKLAFDLKRGSILLKTDLRKKDGR